MCKLVYIDKVIKNLSYFFLQTFSEYQYHETANYLFTIKNSVSVLKKCGLFFKTTGRLGFN